MREPWMARVSSQNAAPPVVDTRYTAAMHITDVRPCDLSEILDLNEASVPHVGNLSVDDMHWFADHAHYFRVAHYDGRLAGFLIGLRPGLRYRSPNYRWFCARYDDFGYIDRVAVATHARRRGIATVLYENFEQSLRGSVPYLTCEVNLRPPNPSSMQFHEKQGFAMVATQLTDGGAKEVALMEKKL